MTDVDMGTRMKIDREVAAIKYRTVAQQEAKRETVDALLDRSLPIPTDLAAEFDAYIRSKRAS